MYRNSWKEDQIASPSRPFENIDKVIKAKIITPRATNVNVCCSACGLAIEMVSIQTKADIAVGIILLLNTLRFLITFDLENLLKLHPIII